MLAEQLTLNVERFVPEND